MSDRRLFHRLPVDLDAPRSALHIQEPHARDVDTKGVTKGALNRERLVLEYERDRRLCCGSDRDAVVEVQRARCGPVERRRHDNLKVSLAQLCRRHCARGTEREDSATLDRDRDGGEVDVVELDETAALDVRAGEVVEVVESLVGEVRVHARRVLLEHRRDEDGVPKEELGVDPERVRVLGELVPERVQHGRAVRVRLVERGVNVIEQAVPDVERVAGGLRDRGPAVKLLADGRVCIVLHMDETVNTTERMNRSRWY